MSIFAKLHRHSHIKFEAIAYIAILVGVLSTPLAAEASTTTTVTCSDSGSFAITDGVVIEGQTCAGSAVIPDGVTKIRNSAFGANDNLTNVYIPASVTLIENSAFGGDSNLVSVIFAGNAPTVENSAFGGTASGATAYISRVAADFPAIPGPWNSLVLSYQLSSAGDGIVNCTTSGTVTIVNFEVTGNTSCVGWVTIPSQVTTIGVEAFINNSTMSGIYMPSVVTISGAAFHTTTGLRSAYMPLAQTLGTFAFWGCSSLTEVDLPAATTIGFAAFSQDTSLSRASLPSATDIGFGAFYNSALTTIELPLITSVSDNTFMNNAQLTSVSLPSVTSIGVDAFRGTSSLVRVIFAGNAPSVGVDAFTDARPGATADISFLASGFGTESTWHGLVINRAAGPAITPSPRPEAYSGPVITGLSPKVADTNGGSEIVISGQRLAQVTTVTLDGNALRVIAKSDAQISLEAPAHVPGFIDLILKSNSGTLTFQGAFEYKTPVALHKKVTIFRSIFISNKSAKSLSASQRSSVNKFARSATGAALITCSATYANKPEIKRALTLAKLACASAKKANSKLSSRVLPAVRVKSNTGKKILLSLTN
jgi:hypothetical protein